MGDSLFPTAAGHAEDSGQPLVMHPYREDGTWLFDDDAAGLVREPFVGEVNRMLDRLTEHLPNALAGFRLLFWDRPFRGHQQAYEWLRNDPIEGSWYRDETGAEGWLCPSLFCYFPAAPRFLYVRAEPA